MTFHRGGSEVSLALSEGGFNIPSNQGGSVSARNLRRSGTGSNGGKRRYSNGRILCHFVVFCLSLCLRLGNIF